MSNIKRCISYNKKGKRCRTRLGKDKEYFCCEQHKPPNYEMIKESCYICSKELKIEDMVILRCNHIHHIDCLAEWCQVSSDRYETLKCPLCRQDIFNDINRKEKIRFTYYTA